jgi:hypothetical protein
LSAEANRPADATESARSTRSAASMNDVDTQPTGRLRNPPAGNDDPQQIRTVRGTSDVPPRVPADRRFPAGLDRDENTEGSAGSTRQPRISCLVCGWGAGVFRWGRPRI